jgi:hypothetical protein
MLERSWVEVQFSDQSNEVMVGTVERLYNYIHYSCVGAPKSPPSERRKRSLG